MPNQSSDRDAMQYRVYRVIAHILLLGLGVLLASHLFRDPLDVGSTAYRAAHGIVDGAANELRVKGVLLRFPPEYLPMPYSADEIVAGRADRVTVDLDLGSWFDPRPTARSRFIALVQVEIEKYRVENPEISQSQLAQPWKSVSEVPELGLREYVSAKEGGGWGYRIYVPLDARVKTPRGGMIVYECLGRVEARPDRCRTQYQHPSGPYVQYYLSGQLLPRWKEVHTEVLQTVNSFIVH